MSSNLKSIYTYKEAHLGSVFIVIPKIREVAKGLGAVVITFDNGDKRNIETKNADETIRQITDMIEEYYKS